MCTMGDSNTVEIIFKTVDQTTGGTKKVTNTIGDAMKKVTDVTTKAAAAVGAFAVTFDKIMDFGKAGAVVEQTADSFGVLMDKIGVTDDLLGQLRDASNGTVDDMTLMSSTMTLLAGVSDEFANTLANASPEIMEIAKAANKLNPSLGDTTFLYESLMTGIKRGSPLLIDNTGLTLKLGEANQQMADSLGKSVEELTAEEQKQAILNATLKAGNQLIDQVGGTTDSATDAFNRLEAATENLGDKIKTKLAPFLTKAADAATTLVTWNDQIESATQSTTETINESATSWEAYSSAMVGVLSRGGKVAHVENGIIKVYKMHGGSLEDVTDQYELYNQIMFKNNATIGQTISKLKQEGQALEEVGGAASESGRLFEQDYMGALAKLGEYGDITLPYRELEQRFSDLSTLMNGELGQATKDYQQDLKDLQTEMLDLLEQMGEEQVGSDAYNDLKEQYDEVKGKIDEVKQAHIDQTNQIVYDLLLQRAGIDGVTEAEYQVLVKLGEGMGIFDQTTADAMGAADKAFQDLANGAGVDSVLAELQAMIDKLNGINGYEAKATVIIDYKTQGTYSGVGEEDPGWFAAPTTETTVDHNGDVGMATGGDFIVPPGYPNDSFSVGTTSGERVTVSTPGQQAQQNIDWHEVGRVFAEELARVTKWA